MNEPERSYKRTRERQYSAHHTLLHIASISLEKAEKKEPGWFNEVFVSLTFSALAVEAMANAIGDRIVPDWAEFESANPGAKLRILAERLGIPYEKDRDPWGTVRWLGKLRNEIAHPKAELVVDEHLISEKERADRAVDPPESRIERKITVENARRALEAVEALKWLYCDRLPVEDRFGLASDGWTTSTEFGQ